MISTEELINLIEKFQQGDTSVFSEIYVASIDNAYRFAKTLLQSEEDIEDVLQNSFVRVYNNLGKLREREKYNAWLKILVENECKAYLKKKRPLLWIGEQTGFDNLVAEQAVTSIPDDELEKGEIFTALAEIIESLPEEKKSCIKLFYFEEKKISEIAEIQGVSAGTVKTRIFNAKKKIGKKLESKFPGDTRLKSIGIAPLIATVLAFTAKKTKAPASIAAKAPAVASAANASVGVTGAASAGATATTAATAIGTASTTGASVVGVGTVATAGTVASTTATVAGVVLPKVAAVVVAAGVATGGGVAVKTHIDNSKIKAEQQELSATVQNVDYTDETTSVIYSQEGMVVEILTEALSEAVPKIEEVTESAVTKPASTVEASNITSQSSTEKSSETVKHTGFTTVRSSSVLGITTTRRQTNAANSEKETTTKTAGKATTTRRYTSAGETTTTKKATTTARANTTVKENTTANELNYEYNGGTITSYSGGPNAVIPEEVNGVKITSIGRHAFMNNAQLQSVTIPSTVTFIGYGAFGNCANLSSVTIPDSVTAIDDGAFDACPNLKSITVPESVTEIGEFAFDENTTINCKEGSVAHQYADANGYEFNLI